MVDLRGMVHGTKVKIMVRLHNCGTVWQRCARCSGRPTGVDDDKIKAMIVNNRRNTTREIAEKLNISHRCVERHLK